MLGGRKIAFKAKRIELGLVETPEDVPSNEDIPKNPEPASHEVEYDQPSQHATNPEIVQPSSTHDASPIVSKGAP